MSAGNFPRCLAIAWLACNDGQGLHNSPGDAGGWTRLGVTFANFQSWRQAKHQPVPTLADFTAASQAELEAIIEAWIWHPCGAEDLPAGVDLMVFEAAFGSGPEAAVKLLQGVLGVTQDGDCGPVTLADAGACNPADLVRRFAVARRAWLVGLGDSEFQAGWLARLARDEATALGWLGVATSSD